jgi:hypothetical protein
MPAAIAIPAIIGAASAGTALVGAHMQASAAKNAANTQVAASDRAQGFNQQVYNDQRQLMQPYVTNGQTSLAKLMAQHWGGDQAQYMPQQGPGPMPGQQGRSLAAMQGPGMGAPPQAGMGGGPTVKMTSPDGSETQDVPREHVPMFLAKGARVIG